LPGDKTTNESAETGTRFSIIKFGSQTCRMDRLPQKAPDGTDLQMGITLAEKDVVEVSDNQVTRFQPDRFGFTFGALTVPFKYHLTGNKDFTGSASVGPYAGYRATGDYFGLSAIGFLAYSNISVAQNVNGQATSQNLAGVSYGIGLIGTLKGSFQIGGVLGFDRVNGSAGYQYNGKPWLALEIGYSFMQ